MEENETTSEFYEAEAVALAEAKEFAAAQVFASLAIAANLREAVDLMVEIVDTAEIEEIEPPEVGEEDADIVE